MKKIFFVTTAVLFVISVSAQVNNGGKGKNKQKDKGHVTQTDKAGNSNDKEKYDEYDRKVWEGVGDNSCMKPSKNQPAKVRSAFQRDYPLALNVRWTKCRGDWTATFNGLIFRSTAVYHANGDRRDTRTLVNRDNIPRRVLDEIFKRFPVSRIDEAIKIEVPNGLKDIFRIKNIIDGKVQFDFFDSDGVVVTYDY